VIFEKDSLFETTVFTLFTQVPVRKHCSHLATKLAFFKLCFSFNVPFCELVVSLQNAGGECDTDSFKSYYRPAC